MMDHARVTVGGQMIKQIAKFLYHVGRSKVDRKHALKYNRDFVDTTALLLNLSEEEKDEFADVILDLSDKWEYEPEELAEASYYLASSGVDVEEYKRYLTMSMKLADMTLCDLNVAVDALVSISTVYKEQSLDKIISHITTVVWETQLTEEEVIQIYEMLGPHVDDFDFIASDIIKAYPGGDVPDARDITVERLK